LRTVRARLPGGCAFLSQGRNGIGSGKAGRLFLLLRVPGISSCPLPGAPGYQDNRARGGGGTGEADGLPGRTGMSRFLLRVLNLPGGYFSVIAQYLSYYPVYR
jgi:hypothetical protein